MTLRQAILPVAARYEGANGGTVTVGGGTVANVLTQVVAFPSANSTIAPKGVDQVRALKARQANTRHLSLTTSPHTSRPMPAGVHLLHRHGRDRPAGDDLLERPHQR